MPITSPSPVISPTAAAATTTTSSGLRLPSTRSSSASSVSRRNFYPRLKSRRRSLSKLTEESLDHHNRRHDDPSPYYRGLLHFDNSTRMSGPGSPGRESRMTSISTKSSVSTVMIRLQEWGTSCFRGKRGSIPTASVTEELIPRPKTAPSSMVAAEELTPRLKTAPPSMVVAPAELKPVTQVLLSSRRMSVSAVQDVFEISSMRGELVRGGGGSGGNGRSSLNLVERKSLRERSRVVTFTDNEAERREAQQEAATITTMTPAVAAAAAVVVKEREFVWADRYRPKRLKDFLCNKDRAAYLHGMVTQGKCSHSIFEGLPGVGKRTMVWALLREVFGPEKLETRNQETIKFNLKGEALPYIDVHVTRTAKHVEINLSDLRGYEMHVIQELLKGADEMPSDCDLTNCQAIVLYEADRLSTDTQNYLHWVMERSKSCRKIIFCCTDASKLQPLSSICDIIQLMPPSNSEIVDVLEFIAEREGIDLPHHLAETIAEKSKQNLRQAIRSFEASWQLNSSFTEINKIMTGWEEDIAIIAKNIIDEQSPKQLYIIRGKLRRLIEHNVSPEFIFSTLVDELKKNTNEKVKPKIDALYHEYNRDIGLVLDTEKSLGLVRSRPEEAVREPLRKNLYHFMKIEEFTAKFMSFYKSCVNKSDSAESDGY